MCALNLSNFGDENQLLSQAFRLMGGRDQSRGQLSAHELYSNLHQLGHSRIAPSKDFLYHLSHLSNSIQSAAIAASMFELRFWEGHTQYHKSFLTG